MLREQLAALRSVSTEGLQTCSNRLDGLELAVDNAQAQETGGSTRQLSRVVSFTDIKASSTVVFLDMFRFA